MMTSTITQFIKEDIWTIPEKNYSPLQRKGIIILKTLLLAIQGFKNDLCQLRASALTLYTLLSIVPVIALLFGVAKGFGFEKKLEQQLLEQSSDQDTMMLQLIEFSQNMLSSTKGGVVAGIGVVVLFWTVIKVIGNIEESFNHIWKIKNNRTLARKLSDYLSLMMLAPVLLIASSSMTVFVKTQISWLIQVIQLPEFGTRMVLYAMTYSPLLIMTVLFSFIFIFMPNHKIKFRAGLVAGITTGILYQLVQWIYLSLQLGASSYNAIYGSFAALPLFLIWLQLVWMVVLLGCEISFYVQNYESYRHNERFSNLSFSLKKLIAFKVCHFIIMRFVKGEKAASAELISEQLQLPVSIIQKTLSTLLEAGLIVELNADDEDEKTYHPAHDVTRLSIAYINNALENNGQNFIPGFDRENTFYQQLNASGEHVLLKDIVFN